MRYWRAESIRCCAMPPRTMPSTVGRFGDVLKFSFPVFDYVGRCRHGAEAKMGRRGRHIVHQHLRRVLIERIRDQVGRTLQQSENSPPVPSDLATEYIVTTFILVLNWWVESTSLLSALEVDDLFLRLVVSALTSGDRRAMRR